MRAALIALTATALIGCGGGEEEVSPEEDALADAVAATSAQKTARLTMTGTIEVAGEEGTYEAQGAMRFKPPAATIAMTMSIAGQQVELESRQIGAVSYIRPGDSIPLPGGKTWMKLDLGAALGQDAAGALSSGTDPAQYLEMLRGSGDVSEAGTEDIGGVPTTHYEATIDYEELAESDDDQLAALAEQSLRFSAESEVPVEVWIDDQGLIRRQRIQIETKEVNDTPGQKQDMLIDYVDYGAPVTGIEAPPEADVYDATGVATDALG